MAKLDIKYLKLYIFIREVVNFILWIAMLSTAVPTVVDYNQFWIGKSAASGFAIFSAVIARFNRIQFTLSIFKTTGTQADNAQRRVKNHSALKFFYFPLALMLAAVSELKSSRNLYDANLIGDMGSVTAYLLGSFIIVINLIIIFVIIALCKRKVQLIRPSAIMLAVISILFIFFLAIGLCLAIYAAAVISRSGEWRVSQSLTFTLVMVEIAEIVADQVLNYFCLD